MTDTKPTRRGIWWLASYPKSGSTWARMVMNAAVSGFPPNINAAYQYVSGDQLVNLVQAVCPRPVTELADWELLYYRPASLLSHLYLFPNRDACLKTHNANIVAGNTPLCPAEMSRGAVYIVRDPRDVAVSFAKHVGKSIDDAIALMGRQDASIAREDTHSHFLGSWSGHVTSWTDERSAIPCGCVRYEQMQENPVESFRSILKGMGLGDHEQVMDRIPWAVEQCELDRLKTQEHVSGFREASRHTEFFGSGKVGGWQDVLTTEQVERIERDHGETMQAIGYELSLVESV